MPRIIYPDFSAAQAAETTMWQHSQNGPPAAASFTPSSAPSPGMPPSGMAQAPVGKFPWWGYALAAVAVVGVVILLKRRR